MRPVRLPVFGHGRNHLPQDSGAIAGLVLGNLPHELRQERDLGSAVEQRDWGFLPHGLVDAKLDSKDHGRAGAAPPVGGVAGDGRRLRGGCGKGQEALGARSASQVGTGRGGGAPSPRAIRAPAHSWWGRFSGGAGRFGRQSARLSPKLGAGG